MDNVLYKSFCIAETKSTYKEEKENTVYDL